MMMVMVMMMQGTILTRAHKNLDPEHESTKALTPELRLQYQRVREIDTKSGTEDDGPGLPMMMIMMMLMRVLCNLVLHWTL